MSLLAKLTVTPLLYACGALLLLSIGLGVALAVQGSELEAAVADVGRADAEAEAAATERDAWKGKADGCVVANEAYADVVGTLNGELALAQAENHRLEKAGRDAVAAARARALDADRTLKRFVAQFHAQSREPQCAATLARLEQACPAFGGY